MICHRCKGRMHGHGVATHERRRARCPACKRVVPDVDLLGPVKKLPGCDWRPWLAEQPPPGCTRFGHEYLNGGRVRVTLGRHRLANSGQWQYRYRLVAAYALGRPLKGPLVRPSSRSPGQVKAGRLKEDDWAEHVDHEDEDTQNDRVSNLRVLGASLHGRIHATATADAVFVPDVGLVEVQPLFEERLQRAGPVLSARPIPG